MSVVRSEKQFLSVPVAIAVERPTLFWIMDGITHERISDIRTLDAGENVFTVALTRPARFAQWMTTPIDIR